MGADTCTSPFFTIRIDSLLVLLYVTCIAISKVIGGVIQISGPTYDHASVMIGVDAQGTVTGVQFLENTDSPGFGSKASDPNFTLSSGKTFYGQFAGKKVADGFVAGETFDAISGATITSRGVATLLDDGTAVLTQLLKEHGND